jgi:hypothetical protein
MFYVLPLALELASGLQYRLWMHRAIQEYGRAGVLKGPMFRVEANKRGQVDDDGKSFKRAKVGGLDLVFRPLLGRVQEKYPETIGADVNVEEEYSSSRSLKRGATSQARNKQIPANVIEANNRWRKEERARGSTPHMVLFERYADGKAVVPLLVRFSKELSPTPCAGGDGLFHEMGSYWRSGEGVLRTSEIKGLSAVEHDVAGEGSLRGTVGECHARTLAGSNVARYGSMAKASIHARQILEGRSARGGCEQVWHLRSSST